MSLGEAVDDDSDIKQGAIISFIQSRTFLPVFGLAALVLESLLALTGWLPGPASTEGVYTPTTVLQDASVTILAAVAAFGFVKTLTTAAANEWIEPRDSRKLIHTLSAPLYIFLWPLYSAAPGARYFACIVTLMNAIRLIQAGTGKASESSLANAVSRSGIPILGELDFTSLIVCTFDGQCLGGEPFAADHEDRQFAITFQFGDLAAFSVVQVVCDGFLDGDGDLGNAGQLGCGEHFADDFDRHALGALDKAAAATGRAFAEDAPLQARADSLTGHFNQAERARAENLGASAIPANGLFERLFETAAMPVFAHVDEVVDDHATQVAEAELSGDFPGGDLVESVGGFLGGSIGAEIAAVDIDGDERFGLIDDK